MALGAAKAVSRSGKSKQTVVIGTDGINPAFEAVQSGQLAATVNTFPYELGKASVELALRLLEGQSVARIVHTPQELVTQTGSTDSKQ